MTGAQKLAITYRYRFVYLSLITGKKMNTKGQLRFKQAGTIGTVGMGRVQGN
jgi:hypothetical protein